MSTPGEYLAPAASGYNIYRGATSGNPMGQARAGLGAANLYGKMTGAQGINTGATSALDLLNIYQGLQRGGLQGYGNAAASGMQLAGTLMDNPALSTVGGYIAAPLALYNFGENWKSGATGADALSGAQTGAEIGSVIPGIGTVVGGLIGGAAGALSSAFGPGAIDPETHAVQNVINATSKYGNNPAVASSMANPYLGLAGLMDRRSSTLPEYAQYGRMGEQKFTTDMVNQINAAVKANPSLANDPNAVYNQVVAPWVNKMGSGYSNVGQTYAATNQGLLEDMTRQYLGGQAAQDWKAIGGDEPFANIYQGSPLAGVAQQYDQQLAQQQAQQVAQQRALGTARRDQGAHMAAKGGSMKSDPGLKRKLHELYAGSFANRKRHYDGGGYVNYSSYTAPGATTYYTPPSTENTSTAPTLVDPSKFYTPDATGANSDLSYANQAGIDTINNPVGSTPDTSSSGGGILGSLGSLLGVSSLGQAIQKYGALAPLISAALGSNKPASAPATPAGYGAIPSISTPANPRTYVQPNVQNWYTYGQGPEQSFFSGNQLPTIPGVSPTSSTSTPAAAPGQMTTQPLPVNYNPGYIQPIMRARGGAAAFDSTAGDDYVPDPGHGDGTSDDIDAKLSGGEYVMDAGTVSMLGNGSNEAGARALDQLRHRVRTHAGKHLVKGKQFMKAKAPEKYLGGSKP